MKKYSRSFLLSTLFIFFHTTLFSQADPIVKVNIINKTSIHTTDNKNIAIDPNVLYIGIDNKISIETEGILNLKDLVISISDGSLSGENGSYTVHVTKISDAVVLKVSDKSGQVLTSQSFKSMIVPDISFLKESIPKIRVMDLRNISVEKILGITVGTQVISFSLTTDKTDNSIETVQSVGNQFSSEARNILSNETPGKMITCDNIIVLIDGKQRKIPSKAYLIIE